MLGTADPTSGAVDQISVYSFITGPEGPQVRALSVWGKEALPATGPVEIVPIGLGTALLLLAGAAFVATSRIQRDARRNRSDQDR